MKYLIVNGNYAQAESMVDEANIVSFTSGLTLEQYLNLNSFKTYELLTWEEYYPKMKQYLKSKYVTPAVECTKEDFEEMLNILPPLYWERSETFESFMMSEYLTHNITAMYARFKNRYLCKNVIVGDFSTYISLADFGGI